MGEAVRVKGLSKSTTQPNDPHVGSKICSILSQRGRVRTIYISLCQCEH